MSVVLSSYSPVPMNGVGVYLTLVVVSRSRNCDRRGSLHQNIFHILNMGAAISWWKVLILTFFVLCLSLQM